MFHVETFAHSFRYGGLSFGERSDLVEVNATDIQSVFTRLAVAANGGTDVPVNITLPKLLQDIEALLGNLVTTRNAKVLDTRFTMGVTSHINSA